MLPNTRWRRSSYSNANGGACLEVAELSNAPWHRSSYSNANGGNCVEVAALTNTPWRRSTHSNTNGGNCLEVADGFSLVPIRDSKNPGGPVLTVPAPVWDVFVRSLKR